jgi:peptidoglycan/xylan/chitin deacetylase (PgdA/CDA1 family)
VDTPILLYHHIGLPDKPNPYYVSPEAFRLQMESLDAWGYTPITMALFAEVLVGGGRLPERPVVITFDDGFRDVYQNAFPVMQALGFPGVFYLISSQVDSGPHVRVAELEELAAAGWEFGNHSASHRSLIEGYSAKLVQAEIVQSRLDLEELLGVPIRTFSFPYGLASAALRQQLEEVGYLAAVGVGATWVHNARSIFFLGRSEVRGDFDLADFAALLPYAGTGTPETTEEQGGE